MSDKQWTPADLVRDFHEQAVLPNLGGNKIYRYTFRQAIDHLEKMLGRPPQLRDLTDDNVKLLIETLERNQIGEHTRRKMRWRLHTIRNHAQDAGALPKPEPKEPKPKPKKRKRPPLVPAKIEPGTVREFLVERYVPERLANASESAPSEFHRVLNRIGRFLGRELRIEDLSDSTIRTYLGWLVSDQDLSATSANGHRAYLIALARFAHECEVSDYWPRVRKLKESVAPPDAWTTEELKRIFRAAAKYDPNIWHGPMSASGFWVAFLRTNYWTGLRLGSMLRIRREHVNLATGQLYVPPSNIKTRRGKQFRLGEDAVQALERIWLPERELLFDTGRETFKSAKWRVLRDFRAILREAEISAGVRTSMSKFHKLRRTVATQAAIHGGMAAAVALLGHSSEEMTLRYVDQSFMPDADATRILPKI